MERLKRYIAGMFRYRLTAIFFIVGQLIMFCAIFGALGIYNKAFDKENDRLEAMYKNSIDMEITSLNKTDIFTNSGYNINEGNLLLNGKLSMHVVESGAVIRMEVILKANEELPYKMISGRLPGSSLEDSGKKLVALGRDKYKYAYEENGHKYITICNEKYEVVGVIGSEKSDYFDYKIVLNINCVGQNTLKEIISKRNWNINIGSNNADLEESYAKVYGNVKSIDEAAVITATKRNSLGESTIDTTLGRENVKVNVIVYIFCMLNCVVMSEFWIIQRRKELVIRKAFGMSNIRIVRIIAGNVLSLSLFSLLIFLALYGIMVILPIGNILSMQINLFTVVSTFVSIIATIIITMIYPVYKVFKLQPVAIIECEE